MSPRARGGDAQQQDGTINAHRNEGFAIAQPEARNRPTPGIQRLLHGGRRRVLALGLGARGRYGSKNLPLWFKEKEPKPAPGPQAGPQLKAQQSSYGNGQRTDHRRGVLDEEIPF